jgi:hypothetical protein
MTLESRGTRLCRRRVTKVWLRPAASVRSRLPSLDGRPSLDSKTGDVRLTGREPLRVASLSFPGLRTMQVLYRSISNCMRRERETVLVTKWPPPRRRALATELAVAAFQAEPR